jgi:DNA-binding response OmpR family regulator
LSTILLIDDDPKFMDEVERMLAAAGYRILRAATGKDAVDLLEKQHNEISLAIVDLMLPDINGFELIGAISRRANNVKVLATTSVYKDAHLEMAGALGADAAIRKPAAGLPLPEREWLETVSGLLSVAGSSPRGRA